MPADPSERPIWPETEISSACLTAPFSALDDHFRALAMAADSVGEAVRLSDSQISRPEVRRHALTHPDGPAMLFLDDIESEHGTQPDLARNARQAFCAHKGSRQQRARLCARRSIVFREAFMRALSRQRRLLTQRAASGKG